MPGQEGAISETVFHEKRRKIHGIWEVYWVCSYDVIVLLLFSLLFHCYI